MDHMQRIRLRHVGTIYKMGYTGLARARRSACPAHKAIRRVEMINPYDVTNCSGSHVNDHSHVNVAKG